MQIVFKEICTVISSMPIINSKVAALGPVSTRYFIARLRHVENDTDSIFVVITLDALVGIRSVTCNNTVRF